MSGTTPPQPSDDEKDDFLLSCRYGDLDDARQFVDRFGVEAALDVRDDNGNTPLHMSCGNGHEDILDYLFSVLPSAGSSILSKANKAGSTPLHWTALNSHLSIAQKLVQFPSGPGVDLIDIKNAAGRTPLGEAEMVGWDEGAKWFVQVMNLDGGKVVETDDVQPDDDDVVIDAAEAIEVEIEDADGGIAKMTLGHGPAPPSV